MPFNRARFSDNLSNTVADDFDRRFICSHLVAHVINHAERKKLGYPEGEYVAHFPNEHTSKISPARLHNLLNKSTHWSLEGGWRANNTERAFYRESSVEQMVPLFTFVRT